MRSGRASGDPRRRGCAACSNAPEGTQLGTFPEPSEATLPCGRPPGGCDHGLDVLFELPDEKDAWRPIEEIPLSIVAEGTVHSDEDSPWAESEEEEGERQALAADREAVRDLLPLLIPFLSPRQAVAATAKFNGTSVSEAVTEAWAKEGKAGKPPAKQTAHIHKDRAVARLGKLLSGVAKASASIVSKNYAQRPPLVRAALQAAFVLAPSQSRTLVLYLGLTEGERSWGQLARALDVSKDYARANLHRAIAALKGAARSYEERQAVREFSDAHRSISSKQALPVALAVLGGSVLRTRLEEAAGSLARGGRMRGEGEGLGFEPDSELLEDIDKWTGEARKEVDRFLTWPEHRGRIVVRS